MTGFHHGAACPCVACAEERDVVLADIRRRLDALTAFYRDFRVRLEALEVRIQRTIHRDETRETGRYEAGDRP